MAYQHQPRFMEVEKYNEIHEIVKASSSDPNTPKVNVNVEGEINREKQEEFTMDLFSGQAQNTKNLAINNFNKKPDLWLQSKFTRSRLVFMEVTPENVKEVAEAMMTSSPLERVMLTGVNEQVEKRLEKHVKEIWIEKLNRSNDEFKEKFIKHFATEENKFSDLRSILEQTSIDDLMGPHHYIKDLDISEENLNKVLPQFKTNIEEFIVYGESNELADQAPALSQSMDDAPYLTIKASPFNDDSDHGLWRVAFKADKDTLESLKSLTGGKSAPEILGDSNDDKTSYANVDVSPQFLSAFNLDEIIAEIDVENNGDLIKAIRESKEDLEYLRTLFVEEAIYPGGTSPEGITKIISKATSGLGAEGARAVGAAVMWNMVNRPVSTAKGVEFAVGSMTLDGGNDLIKEALDKKIAYKAYYDKLLNYYINQGAIEVTAQKKAVKGLLEAYIAIEKSDEHLLKLIKEGNTYRNYGLEQSNFVKATNDEGVAWLRSLPWFFAAGTGLQGTGMGLATAGALGTTISPFVGVGLAASGGFLFTGSTGATYLSMRQQREANAEHLPKANKGLAIANERFYSAKQQRTALLNIRLAQVTGESTQQDVGELLPDELDNESLGEGLDVPFGDDHDGADVAVEQTAVADGDPETGRRKKLPNELLFMEEKEFYEIDDEIEGLLNDPNAPEVNIKVEGDIDRDSQIRFTMDLFEGQAENNKKIAIDKYNKEPDSWLKSRFTRARLVLMEATVENVKEVAEAMMKASPLERVILVGVNKEVEQHLHAHVQNIWIEKFNASDDEFKQKVLDYFEDIEAGLGNNLEDLLRNASLEKLMGPHQFINDLNISEENLERKLPHFKTNIEEFIVCGDSNELANQAPALSKNMKNAPYLTVKISPFNDNANQGLWRVAFKAGKDILGSLRSLTAGKSAPEILGDPNDDKTSYANVDLSPQFLSAFNLDDIIKALDVEDIDLLINKEDLEYLRSLFIEEAIYPAGTSPEAITKTISKATSSLGAKGALAVGIALMWNLVNRPISTAKGVDFAVGSMTLDGGNDLIKEALDKKIAYKICYDTLLDYYIDQGDTEIEAQNKAVIGLIGAYIAVEKKNEHLLHLIEEGNHFRDYGLEQSNLVKETNDAGIAWLSPLPWLFGAGTGLQGTGIGMATAGALGAVTSPTVGVALAATGGLFFAGSTGSTYLSMRQQRAANAEHLPLANKGLAIANEFFYSVKQQRTSLLNEWLDNTMGTANQQVLKDIPDLVPVDDDYDSDLDSEVGDDRHIGGVEETKEPDPSLVELASSASGALPEQMSSGDEHIIFKDNEGSRSETIDYAQFVTTTNPCETMGATRRHSNSSSSSKKSNTMGTKM